MKKEEIAEIKAKVHEIFSSNQVKIKSWDTLYDLVEDAVINNNDKNDRDIIVRITSEMTNRYRESMTITSVELDSISDEVDGESVIIEASSGLGRSGKFQIQLTDGEHRPSLGCWIIDYNDGGDNIDTNSYVDFDFTQLVKHAENHWACQGRVEWTSFTDKHKNLIAIIHRHNSFFVATDNPKFINSDTSSYEKKFIELNSFTKYEDAISWIKSEFGN